LWWLVEPGVVELVVVLAGVVVEQVDLELVQLFA
jgi:hypothetical protein